MAGVLDLFAGWFGNPLSWVFMGIFILLGVLIGIFLRPWIGNKVIKFAPADHRFIEMGIDEETAISLQCKKVKGSPVNRFFKHHPGFTGIVGRILKKPITLFLGLEGTAYTWKLQEGTWIKIGGLAKALRTVWGEDFWNTVPQRQRNLIEESKINVTVGLDESPITPAGMRSISEEDIKQEEDRKASKTFWAEHQGQIKGWFLNMLFAGGTGFGIALALQIIGILDISSAPTPPPSPPPEVAGMIGDLLHKIVAWIRL